MMTGNGSTWHIETDGIGAEAEARERLPEGDRREHEHQHQPRLHWIAFWVPLVLMGLLLMAALFGTPVAALNPILLE